MKSMAKFLMVFLGFAILGACASSDVAKTESKAEDKELVEPKRIVIGEFTASPDRIPQREEIKEYFEDREEPVTEQEIELGRQLGERLTANLIEKLGELGIVAVRKDEAGALAETDALIEGYFVTIDEGDRLQRMLIGFGAGASELRTLVEVYQLIDGKLTNLGFAEIEAEGGNLPGMLVPVGAGAAAGELGRSLVIGGGVAAVKEVGPETIEAAAERSAEEIADLIEEGYEKRGWL